MTARIQLCPVDASPLDDHTNEELLVCDTIACAHYEVHTTTIIPKAELPNIHTSWSYRLPQEYRT